MHHTLNLAKDIAYLQSLEASQLDAIFFAAKDKLAELGVAEDPSAADKYPADKAADKPTGNLRSITNSVASIAPPVTTGRDLTRVQRRAMASEYKKSVQGLTALHAVVRAKMRAVKHKPTRTPVDEDIAATKAKETARQEKANAKAAARALAREKAKADAEAAQAAARQTASAAAESAEEKRQQEREAQRAKDLAAREKALAAKRAKAAKA